MGIEKNTIDLAAYVYKTPREWEYRWVIDCDPDFPETIRIRYEELTYFNNRTESKYETRGGELSFDKETWEKIKHAVDAVLEKSV